MSFSPEKWLITGASGLLGHVLCGHIADGGGDVTGIHNGHSLPGGITGKQADLLALDKIPTLLDEVRPDVIIHAAGLTNVDACEKTEDVAQMIHADVGRVMADWAGKNGAKMVLISTDHLWGGQKAMVSETEPCTPLNAYARTKLAGEVAVLGACPDSLVVRTNFFGGGPSWRQSISDWVISNLGDGQQISAFVDVFFTPIATPLLAQILKDLILADAKGIYHLCGGERVSKYEFAHAIAAKKGFDPALIQEGSVQDAALSAPRPSDMSLSTKKIETLMGRPMPTIRESIDAIM